MFNKKVFEQNKLPFFADTCQSTKIKPVLNAKFYERKY